MIQSPERSIRTSRSVILRPQLLTPESVDQFFRYLSQDNRSALYLAKDEFSLLLTSDAVWGASAKPSPRSRALRDWKIRGYDPNPTNPHFVQFGYEMRPSGDNGLGQAYTRCEGSLRLSDWCARLRPLIEDLAV